MAGEELDLINDDKGSFESQWMDDLYGPISDHVKSPQESMDPIQYFCSSSNNICQLLSDCCAESLSKAISAKQNDIKLGEMDCIKKLREQWVDLSGVDEGFETGLQDRLQKKLRGTVTRPFCIVIIHK